MKKPCLSMVAFAIVFLSFSCFFSSVNAAEVQENYWSPIATIPNGNLECKDMVTVDGKIYAVCRNDDTTNINYVYDPELDTWLIDNPIVQTSFPITGIGMAVYQSKIYCFGYKFSQVYDTKTRIWSPIICDRQSRGIPQVCIVNDKIYIIGGYIYDNDASKWEFPSSCDTVEMFDPVEKTWTNMTKAPIKFAEATSYVIDKKIYVKYGDFYVFDTQTNQWRIIPTDSSYWGEGSASTTGVYAPEGIYFFKEYYNESGRYETFAYFFNVTSETWTTAEPLPINLSVPKAAVVDDIIYCFSPYVRGVTVTTAEHNYKYTPYGYSITPPDADSSGKGGMSTSTLIIIVTATIAGAVIGAAAVTVLHYKYKHVKEKEP